MSRPVAGEPARRVRDRLREHGPDALLALAVGVGAVAGSYAAVGRTPSFVAAPVAAVVVAATPDIAIRYAILLLGDLGKRLAFASALGATAGLFAVVAGPVRAALGDRRPGLPEAGALTGTLAVALALGAGAASAAGAVVGSAVPLVAAAVAVRVGDGPAVAGEADGLEDSGEADESAGDEDASDADGTAEPDGPLASAARRTVVGGLAGALGVGVVGRVLGARRTVSAGGAGGQVPRDSPAGRLLATAGERSLDVEGLEPLVSDSFYTVDVAQVNPAPDPDEWTLSVTGAVQEEREYSLEDVRVEEPDRRFNTLRCVGEKLNGRKMDTALWTGRSLWELVEPAAPEGSHVMLRAADEFYEEFPLEALRGAFLAYGMNGGDLPRAHGAPARALVPGHWGEINVKWLTEVEILDGPEKGYWEERGWHGTGPVNTVAKLHAENRLGDGRIEVGGHAYAGTRGVERVEVSTDGGSTWTDATLSEPLPGDDVWRQWVHRYEPPAEPHEVVVRAVDGTGTRQPREESNAFPSGPTGWVSREVRP